jgi:outer membrane protein assembly factor BamB
VNAHLWGKSLVSAERAATPIFTEEISMKCAAGKNTFFAKSVFAFLTLFVFAGLCFGQAGITLSVRCGPPTAHVVVEGSGFPDDSGIDIYFDAAEEVSGLTGDSGTFVIEIQVPSSATPGEHTISVVDPSTGTTADAAFKVDTTWLQFGFTAKGARVNPYENVLDTTTAASLGLDWKFAASNSVVNSPAVVNGVVYASAYNNNFYALNANTGAQLWSVPINLGWSSPAVAGGRIYVGVGYNVVALNANTGTQLWSYTTGDYVEGPVTVADGVAYFGSIDDNVYAVDTATGSKLWNYTTGYFVDSAPAVGNGVVYVISQDNNLYALNAATGAKLWSFAAPIYDWNGPAVVNGVVYFGSANIGSGTGSVYALNAVTGKVIWSFPADVPFCSPPAVDGDVLYIGDDNGTVYALNALNGSQIWSYTVSSALGSNICAAPAAANGVVYVASVNDSIYALNATSGDLLWSYATGNEIFSSPVVANGVVYVGSMDGNVYAFNSRGIGIVNKQRGLH